MDWSSFYGLMMFGTGALCWLSGSMPLQRLWWWTLMPSWAISNLIHAKLIPPPLLGASATLDLAMLITSAFVLRSMPKTLYAVCLPYIGMLSLHAIWLVVVAQNMHGNSYVYLLAANLLYLLLLIIVGARAIPMAYTRIPRLLSAGGRFVADLAGSK